MEYSQGYRYYLTCIDHFSHWPEAVPIADMEAPTVASALVEPAKRTDGESQAIPSYASWRKENLHF